jgi:hypothetical protein
VPLAKSLLAQDETFIGFVFKNAIDFSLRVISFPNLETSKVEVNLSPSTKSLEYIKKKLNAFKNRR